MSKKILSWFNRRKKHDTLQFMRRHLELTIGTVEELSKAIKFKNVEDETSAKSSINRVGEYEKEADSLRRRISSEISRSAIPSSERGDLLRLVRITDWIADWSFEAARILASTPIHKLPPELMDVLFEMVERVKNCVHLVVRCVDKLLSEDIDQALKLADQVELIEEEVDGLYQQIRIYYPKLDYKNMNPGETILISQFIDAVEYIADWCENTIDQIRVIAIGSY